MAIEAFQAKEWEKAGTALDQIYRLEPDYRDVPALRQQVNERLAAAKDQNEALRRQQADALRAEMNQSFRDHEWDEALHAAEALVQLYPNDMEARPILERLQLLDTLYKNTSQAMQRAAWLESRTALQRLLALEPAYRDAEELGKRIQFEIDQQEARRKMRIAALRSQLQEALAHKNWDDARTLVDSLLAQVPNDFDTLQLRERLGSLQDLYTSAREAIDRQAWVEARALLRQIESQEENYRDTRRLLDVVNTEATLANQYEQARNLLGLRQFSEAREILLKLRDQRQNYRDVSQLLQQAENNLTRICPRCGAVHPITRRFCNRCGTNMDATNTTTASPAADSLKNSVQPQMAVRRCPNCGTESRGTNRFCTKCGTPLPPPVAVASSQAMPTSTVPETRTCANCGAVAQHRGKFCLQCGKPLASLTS